MRCLLVVFVAFLRPQASSVYTSPPRQRVEAMPAGAEGVRSSCTLRRSGCSPCTTTLV
jgi:hypothetical protein